MSYCAGMAIIAEGQTERVFYSEYLRHLSVKLGCEREDVESPGPEDCSLAANGRRVLVKIDVVGTVSQMPNSGIWFQRACLTRHPGIPWHAFLAYDTDEHNCRISKFYEGDWAILRQELSGAADITDLAAEADIEDVILCDLPSVLRYLGLPPDTPAPSGGKGKSKMKRLYRQVAPYNAYHEGGRARGLIKSLDFEALATSAPIRMGRIEGTIRAELDLPAPNDKGLV